MTLGRRHLLFVVAVAFAAATAGGLYLSLGTIRDTVQFNRILRRIDPADPNPSLLEEAAGFAQSREDWRTLLGLAWEIDNRAGTLGYLATEASRRFPSEPIWRSIAAFAALEREDRSSARQLMSVRAEGAEADELEEWMMLLARVQPEDPRGSRSALRELLSGAGLFPRSSAVAAAEINRDPASFQQAWQATAVGAFALQGALEAAEAGNSVLARSLIDAARGDSRLPGAERCISLCGWTIRNGSLRNCRACRDCVSAKLRCCWYRPRGIDGRGVCARHVASTGSCRLSPPVTPIWPFSMTRL